MMKFNTKFDRTNLKTLRNEMQELLEKYGVKANLEIEVGNMSFSEAEVSIKIKAKIKGAKTRADSMTEMMVKSSGLKMVASNGDTIVEYNSRARKMPWVYKCGTTGKMYKCSEDNATRRFAA